ncbi:sulfurtransferase TusA family protein [Synechococcus sp. AH-551-E05]|nr:sulfurtransferase TusA family protein [Synechococcus sp. AH-551-E05]MDB4650994.1 sulfurtransferase TusA family protein [Synechococcus sp. AH-551-E05]
MTDSRSLDLRGTPCPVNYVRCKLTLERMHPGDQLEVDLDRGEPEEMVVSGLRDAGHHVVVSGDDPASVHLQVTCGG